MNLTNIALFFFSFFFVFLYFFTIRKMLSHQTQETHFLLIINISHTPQWKMSLKCNSCDFYFDMPTLPHCRIQTKKQYMNTKENKNSNYTPLSPSSGKRLKTDSKSESALEVISILLISITLFLFFSILHYIMLNFI